MRNHFSPPLPASLAIGVILAAGALSGTVLAPPAMAQTAPRASGTSIAVIDINAVFRQHVRFKQSMDFIKRDVEQFEAFLRQQQKQMSDMAEKMKELKPTSPDYKRQEEDLARLGSDLQVQAQLKRKEFLEREARLYYNVYHEVVDAVAQFSQSQGISLVLRFSSQPIEEGDRSSVLYGVNRAVVFQRNLNITDLILQQLNSRVAPEVGRGGPVLPPRPTR